MRYDLNVTIYSIYNFINKYYYCIIQTFKQNTIVGTTKGAEPRNSNRRGLGLESWSNFVH